LFSLEINRISLAEFDIGGVLYHARYFKLYEKAREALLDQINFPYPELVAQGKHLAVTESQQKFLRPIRYGDSLTVEVRAGNVRKASLTFNYEIKRKGDELVLHRASTKHAHIVSDSSGQFKPQSFSAGLYEKLTEFSKKTE
jgi:acyl-CoA thioester hydrolase